MKKTRLYPLSGVQKYICNVTPGNDTCLNTPLGVRIKGKIDKIKLQEAIQKTVDENDVFRFQFEQNPENGEMMQYVLNTYQFQLREITVEGDCMETKKKNMVSYMQNLMKNTTKLDDGKVKWDMALYRLGEENYILFGYMNHILCDGVGSMNAMANIVSNYNGAEPQKAADYMEFVKETCRRETDENSLMARKALRDNIKNYQEMVDVNEIGDEITPIRLLTQIEIEPLKEYARKNKMGLFHIAMFLFHSAIASTFKKTDTLVSIASGNRKLKYMHTVGAILNLYCNELQFQDQESMREKALECRNHCLKAMKEDVASYLTMDSLFSFIVTYQNYGGDSQKAFLGNAELSPFPNELAFQLWNEVLRVCFLLVFETPEQMIFSLGCDKKIFTDEVLEQMRAGFELAARALTEEDMTFGEYCEAVSQKAGKSE